MVHISGKRYKHRPEKYTTVKVYSNCDTVSLYVDGVLKERKVGGKIFKFRIPLTGETRVKVVAEGLEDEAVFHFTPNPVESYKLNKKTAGGENWT
jgi:beta-galactosidase